MSATVEEFFSKHAKAWKAIVNSPPYKDAIDTVQQTNESLQVLGVTPPEVAGIGHILFAKQQGALEVLTALTNLADVPADMAHEEPPDSEKYPDPLEELAAAEDNRTKPKRKRN